MADRIGRRVSTVCVELVRGTLTGTTMHVLLHAIISEVYGIPTEELYGVAVNGVSRIFIKFKDAGFYTSIVNKYQEKRLAVNTMVEVCLHDVSSYVTWVKVRNVPFEATEHDVTAVFSSYGKIHSAVMGVWQNGPYEGLPEGSFTLKMTLRQPIPSYVFMEVFRTQVYVYYSGQRKTCRLCGSFEHMAAQCYKKAGRREQVPVILHQRNALEVSEEGVRPNKIPCRWSDEVDRAEATMEESVTLTVDKGQTTSTSDEEGTGQQDGLLEEVLSSFLHDVEEGQVDEGCNLVQATVQQDQEVRNTVCTNVNVHNVVAEVHRAEKTGDEVCGEGSSRKRTAGTSEMDDVLTPGQRTGVKSWRKDVCHKGKEGRGNVGFNGSRDNEGIGGVNKQAVKKDAIQQDGIGGCVPRRKGKPPLLK